VERSRRRRERPYAACAHRIGIKEGSGICRTRLTLGSRRSRVDNLAQRERFHLSVVTVSERHPLLVIDRP
jgi:hypothetical protein